MTTSNTTDKTFFNSNLTGFAWLQRAREITPKKGNPYLGVTLAIQQGTKDDGNTLYVDTIVVGAEAKQLVKKYMEQINNRDVRAGARIVASDMYVDPFIYQEGHAKAGQAGASLKGRLLKLASFKLNGELVPELVYPTVTFDSEYWPLTVNVSLEGDDPDCQIKAAKLLELGYKFNDAANIFELAPEGKDGLVERRKQFSENFDAEQQNSQKVVNG